MADISVVIPSYNSIDTIGRTLRSLEAQRVTGLLKEVIVVDSSDDGCTPEFIEKNRSDITQVIRLTEKTIPGAARNIGAKSAGGLILAFIDSDAYAAEDWLGRITTAYREGCKVGGGAILLPDFQRNSKFSVVQYFLQFSEYQDFGNRRIIRFSPSCNLFCENEIFIKIGGFPEIRASEDVLFGLKVSDAMPYYFDPQVRAYHVFSNDKARFYRNQKLLGKYIIHYRRLYYKKHWIYKGLMPVLLLPLFTLIKFIKILRNVMIGGNWHYRLSFFKYLHLIAAGLFCWALGFAEGCFEKVRQTGSSKINICGIEIDNVSMNEAIERIGKFILEKKPRYVVTPNVDHLVKLQKDSRFKEIYDQASLVLADGVPVMWAARFLGTPLQEKVSGSDLLVALCQKAAKKGYRLFFLGGLEGVAEKARERLEKDFPGIQITGTYSPPLGFERDLAEKEKIEILIRNASADIVFVGLGAPKQEKWISENYKMLNVPVSIGVGVSFDFVAGTVKRAPKWMQKIGLEWFWRLSMEPRRLWRRYLVEDPYFFWMVLRQKFFPFFGLLNT